MKRGKSKYSNQTNCNFLNLLNLKRSLRIDLGCNVILSIFDFFFAFHVQEILREACMCFVYSKYECVIVKKAETRNICNAYIYAFYVIINFNEMIRFISSNISSSYKILIAEFFNFFTKKLILISINYI